VGNIPHPATGTGYTALWCIFAGWRARQYYAGDEWWWGSKMEGTMGSYLCPSC